MSSRIIRTACLLVNSAAIVWLVARTKARDRSEQMATQVRLERAVLAQAVLHDLTDIVALLASARDREVVGGLVAKASDRILRLRLLVGE